MMRKLLVVLTFIGSLAACGGGSDSGLGAACGHYTDHAERLVDDPAGAAEAWTKLDGALPDEAPHAPTADAPGAPAVVSFLLERCGDEALEAFATANGPDYQRFTRVAALDAAITDPVAAGCDRFVNFVQVHLTGDSRAQGEAWVEIGTAGPPELATDITAFIDAEGAERTSARERVLGWVDERCGAQGDFALALLDGRATLPVLSF